MNHSVIKKILIAVMIVAGILVVLFVAREVAIRFFGYKPPAISSSQRKDAKAVEITLDPEEQFHHAVTDKYIYFVRTDRVSIADANGKSKAEFEIIATEPVVRTKGKYVIVGDVGGKKAYLFEGAELKNTIETTGAIVDASVNASGYTVLVIEGDMHKRDVMVYDGKGKEQFEWNSGSLFVLNACVADNNKNVIISTMDTSNGMMKSVLAFYNMSGTDAIATESYENELIASLAIGGNYVFCVGDSKTVVYRVSGEKCGEISYGGRTLITYRSDNDRIAMAFAESALSGKRYDIETYNASGSLYGTYELDHKIDYIDFSQNTLAISRERLINVVDAVGREKKLVDPGVDLLDVHFIGGVSQAVGFTAKGAFIFSVT